MTARPERGPMQSNVYDARLFCGPHANALLVSGHLVSATVLVESARADRFQAGCSRVQLSAGTAPSYLVNELHRATDLEIRRRLYAPPERLASITDCPTHTHVDCRRSVVFSRRSACLEQVFLIMSRPHRL